MFALSIFFVGVVPSILWAWKGTRSKLEAFTCVIPSIAWFFFGKIAQTIAEAALPGTGIVVGLVLSVACIAATAAIGGRYRDRAIKEALEAAAV